MDRIHGSLAPNREYGPPRDIIVKLHYFCTKEQLLKAALNKESLQFQGHNYQIYQDLSQQTLHQRKAMKPHLQVFQHHRISYCWDFPFAVHFTFTGTSYTCKTADDLLTTIHDLCISTPETCLFIQCISL